MRTKGEGAKAATKAIKSYRKQIAEIERELQAIQANRGSDQKETRLDQTAAGRGAAARCHGRAAGAGDSGAQTGLASPSTSPAGAESWRSSARAGPKG